MGVGNKRAVEAAGGVKAPAGDGRGSLAIARRARKLASHSPLSILHVGILHRITTARLALGRADRTAERGAARVPKLRRE